MEELDQARRAFAAARDYRATLNRLEPDNTDFKRLLVNSWMNLGIVDKHRGDLRQSLQEHERAQQMRRELLEGDPHNPTLRRDYAMGSYNLADLHLMYGDEENARRLLEVAITDFQRLLKFEPSHLDGKFRLAVCHRRLADLLAGTVPSDVQPARQQYRRAIQHLAPLAAENPDVLDYQLELSSVSLNQGYLELCNQQIDAALESFGRAEAILRGLRAENKDAPAVVRNLALVLLAKGETLLGNGQSQTASTALQEAEQLMRHVVEIGQDEADRDTLRDVQELLESVSRAE
jgi:tetratricopeptide (TPR) repeat protein